MEGTPWGSLLLIDVHMFTEKEVCPEPIKERCSDRKTRRKLGMMVNGWNAGITFLGD